MFVGGRKLTGGCEICDGLGHVDTLEKVGDWPKGDRWVLRVSG